jgi:hypothetical protein
MLAHATTNELPLLLGAMLTGGLVVGAVGASWLAGALGRRTTRRTDRGRRRR